MSRILSTFLIPYLGFIVGYDVGFPGRGWWGWWVGALSSQPLRIGEVEQAGPGKALPLVAFFVQPVVSLTLTSETLAPGVLTSYW